MTRLSSSIHELLTEDVLNSLFSKKIFTITNFLDLDIKMLTKITNLTYKVCILNLYIMDKLIFRIINEITGGFGYSETYFEYFFV